MKMTIRQLKKIIRKALSEGPAGPGVTANPQESNGFYSYDLERGTDIYSFWYRSPGDKGEGNPGRPDDAEEYIGFKTKGATPADAAEEAAPTTDNSNNL